MPQLIDPLQDAGDRLERALSGGGYDPLQSAADRLEAALMGSQSPPREPMADTPMDIAAGLDPWTMGGQRPPAAAPAQDPAAPSPDAPHYDDSAPPSERIAQWANFHRGQATGELAYKSVFPFVGSGPTIMRQWRGMKAREKLERDPTSLTTNEWSDLGRQAAMEEDAQRDRGFWERVGEIAAQAPAFAAEFGLTGGLGAMARAGAAKAIPGFVERGLGKAMEYGADAAVRTALNPELSAEAVLERRMPRPVVKTGTSGRPEIYYDPPKEGWTESTLRGALDGFIENASEMMGPTLTMIPGIKQLGAAINKHLPAFMHSREGAAGMLRDFAESVGYHGVIGEEYEERVADIARSLTGNQPLGDAIPSFMDIATEMTAFAIPGAGMRAVAAAEQMGRQRAARREQAATDYQSAYARGGQLGETRSADQAVNESLDAMRRSQAPFGTELQPLPTLTPDALLTPQGVDAFIQADPEAARAIAQSPKVSRSEFGRILGIDDAAIPLNRAQRRDFTRMLRDRLVEMGETEKPKTEAAPVDAAAQQPEEPVNEEEGQGQGRPEGLLAPDSLRGATGAAETTTVGDAAPEATPETPAADQPPAAAGVPSLQNTLDTIDVTKDISAKKAAKLRGKKPKQKRERAAPRNVKGVLSLAEKYRGAFGELESEDLSFARESATDSGQRETDFLPPVIVFSNTKNGRSFAKELREQLPERLRNKVVVAKAGERALGEDFVQEYGMERVLMGLIGRSYQDDDSKAQRIAKAILDNPLMVEPQELYEAKKFMEMTGADPKEGRAVGKLRPELVNVNDLAVGDRFTIAGDEHEVKGVDPEGGAVTVRDGMDLELPEGYQLPIDEGSLIPVSNESDLDFDVVSDETDAPVAEEPPVAETPAANEPDTRKGPAIGLFGQNTDAGTQYGLGLGGITPNETALERRKQDLMKRADSMYWRTKDEFDDPIRTELRRVIQTFRDEPAKNTRSWDNMEAALNNIEPKIKAYEADKKGFDETKKARASDEMIQAVADAIVQIPADKNNSIPSPERIVEQIRRMGLDIEGLYSKTTAAGRAAELQDAIDRSMKGNQLFEDEDQGGPSALRIGAAGMPPVRRSPSNPDRATPISVDSIRKWVSMRFRVPIRAGHLMARKALGIYRHVVARRSAPQLVRLLGQAYGNLGVITHELAHHIDRVYGVRTKIPNSIKSELVQLDYDYPKRKRVTEGFAEYLRILTTGSVAEARTRAPKFHAWFHQTFLAKEPTLKQNIRDLRARINEWARQSFSDEVKSRIRDNRKPIAPFGRTWREWFGGKADAVSDWLSNQFLDKFHPAYKLSKDYKRYQQSVGKATLAGDTVFEYITATLHTAPAQAVSALEHGVHLIGAKNFGDRIGAGLVESLRKNGINAGNYDDWRAYAYARHAVDSWAVGQNPGISIEAATATRDKYQSPQFEAAAEALTQFNNDLLDMLVNAGVLKSTEAAAMKRAHPTYLPLRRVKDEERGQSWLLSPNKLVNPARPVHKRRGSDYAVLDPVIATMERALEFYTLAIKQQAALKLIREIEGTEGAGKYADRVPPKMKQTQTSVYEALKALEQTGAIPPGSARDMMKNDPAMAAAAVAIWKPNYDTHNGAPVQRFIINGEPVLYWFEPEMLRMVNALDETSLPMFLRMTLGSATSLFKTGATGVSLSFALPNIPKDMMNYLYLTDRSWLTLTTLYKPLEMTGRYLRHKYGGRDDIMVATALEHGFDAMTRAGSLQEPDKLLRREFLGRTMGQRVAGVFSEPIRTVGDFLEATRELVAWSEVGPRLAEFEYVMNKRGYDNKALRAGKKPPRHVIIEAINAARDITTNFSRSGHTGKLINAVTVNYFNAAIQGLDRVRRAWRDHPVRTMFRTAAFAAVGFAVWLRVKDMDWYKTAPAWLKYGYFVFWNGDDGAPGFRIPFSQDIGTLVIGGTMAILDALFGEPDLEGYAELAASKVIPGVAPAIITPAVEMAFNYSFFSNRAIESKAMEAMPARLRYTQYTTETMKWLGEFTGDRFGVGPARLEHFFDQLTGGIFRAVTMPAERVLSAKMPWRETAEMPGLRSFTIRRDYSRDVDDFYEQLGYLEHERKAQKAGKPSEAGPDADERAYRLRQYADIMGNIRDLTKVDDSDTEQARKNDRYIIGLARHALGRSPLKTYPNPLTDYDGMPAGMRSIIDKYWSTTLFHATQPAGSDLKRLDGESLQKANERRERRNEEIRRAKEEIDDLRISVEQRKRSVRELARDRRYSDEATDDRLDRVP